MIISSPSSIPELLDPRLVVLIKQEIIRNVIKMHKRILIVGRPGTGKTTCAIKAARTQGLTVYYWSARVGHHREIDEAVTVLNDLWGFTPDNTEGGLLVIDNYSDQQGRACGEAVSAVKDAAGSRVVVIAGGIVQVKNIVSLVDVVVRMKEGTAELLFTQRHGLCTIGRPHRLDPGSEASVDSAIAEFFNAFSSDP